MSGRRKHHEEEENQERWLLTYADMITLLVAFFMMMYSMSVLNLEKFKQAAIGIRSGFNGPVMQGKESGDSLVDKGRSTIIDMKAPVIEPRLNKGAGQEPVRVQPPRQVRPSFAVLRAQRVGALAEKINQSLAKVSPGKAVRVLSENKGVAIELMADMIFFPTGTAQLSESAQKVLEAVAGVLVALPNEIAVEGHTNAFQPTPESKYKNSWELSTARATAVVNFLLTLKNIDPRRVAVMGYGQYRPLSKPAAASNLNPNDRVRVFIYQD